MSTNNLYCDYSLYNLYFFLMFFPITKSSLKLFLSTSSSKNKQVKLSHPPVWLSFVNESKNGENEQTRKEEGDNSGRYKIPEPAPCVTLRSIACFSLSPLQLTNTFQTLHMPTLSPYKLSFCIPIFSPTHFYIPWNSITRLL